MKNSNTVKNIIYIISTLLAICLSAFALTNTFINNMLYPCIDKRIDTIVDKKIEPLAEKINIIYIYNREIAKKDSTYKKIWNDAVEEVKKDMFLK